MDTAMEVMDTLTGEVTHMGEVMVILMEVKVTIMEVMAIHMEVQVRVNKAILCGGIMDTAMEVPHMLLMVTPTLGVIRTCRVSDIMT